MKQKDKITTSQKHHKIKNWLINIAVLMVFLLGLAMLFNQPIQNAWINYQSKQQYAKIDKKSMQRGAKEHGKYDYSAIKAIDNGVYSNAIKAQNYDAMGKIEIPAVKMKLPVFKGITNYILSVGAGTLKPNQVMGGKNNYVLAGHHMQNEKLVFSPLQKVKKGDLIYLSNAHKQYIYKATNYKIVDEHDINVIKNYGKKRMITLITCATWHTGEQKRIIVTGILVMDGRTPLL